MEIYKNKTLFISSQYFLYFGILGVLLPYFNLYCYHIGFSGLEIGGISALRTISTALFPLFWGSLADRFRIRKQLYIACNFISMLIWIGFFFTTHFWTMMLITAFYGFFYAPIISFLESFTMEVLGPAKNQYGRIRAWGSVSFILTVVLVGKLIDSSSIRIILGIIGLGSLLQALIGTRVTILEDCSEGRPETGQQLNFDMRLIVFLSTAVLMLVSHGTYYGFFSIHLEKIGYGNTFIGFSWALGVVSEILVMIFSDRIFRRFSLEKVLLFSFSAAVFRWTLLFFAKAPWVILMSQIFHAATYGTFHMASILYIDRLSPATSKTTGQAINNAATYGFGMMIGFFLNGYFYEITSTSTLFLASGGVALLGGVIFAAYHFRSFERTGSPEDLS